MKELILRPIVRDYHPFKTAAIDGLLTEVSIFFSKGSS